MDKPTTLSRVKKLYQLFHEGQIPTLAQHEVNPGFPKNSRENYLYFTLPPCLNFQRSSPAMWTSAFATYNDPETRYLFFPEEVVQQTRDKVQRDLIKHKLALQKNKHTDIWIAICTVLHDLFHDNPRELFNQTKWDVVEIYSFIQSNKKKFPYLSGPKMANYWLYILYHYTDATFKNMQEISIIPDTHVLQSTVKLGITDTISNPLAVAQSWKSLLSGSGLTPVEMHPVLWNWSRNGFKPEV